MNGHIRTAWWILCSMGMMLLSCHKESPSTSGNIPSANHQAVGSSAHDLLSDTPYDSLQIEIAYMPGYQPDNQAQQQLQSFLQTYLHKSGGIHITVHQIPDAGKSTYSLQDVMQLESSYRTQFTTGNQIAVFILYVNGQYTDPQVLGITYLNTSMCIFAKTIHDNSGGIGQASRSAVEATVLEHEFGHMLGLVNTGSPMQTPHEDASHPHHCNNSNCLMYYQTETSDLFGFLIGSQVPSLDNNCVHDLEANGGK
ncbi:hypothetical protein [Thermoflavifilum thermophilum]|uniref:Metallo-peptidase family M12B Reprolysin-like n=1 Tax=Thermoflavifilum thermophilum TaxID=1393122 RepID=A0A1I7NHU3_9BACT|nr:hypothetical protein [Thermoflavifilum thermophilum]SFV34230.1 hypothetical protein SAMN05660895_1940 [Thermoflavifilum thermophilum]